MNAFWNMDFSDHLSLKHIDFWNFKIYFSIFFRPLKFLRHFQPLCRHSFWDKREKTIREEPSMIGYATSGVTWSLYLPRTREYQRNYFPTQLTNSRSTSCHCFVQFRLPASCNRLSPSLRSKRGRRNDAKVLEEHVQQQDSTSVGFHSNRKCCQSQKC